MAFIPETQFKLARGEAVLSDYQFGKRHIHHRFCRTCGIGPFGHVDTPDGSRVYAINVRCLEEFEFKSLPVVHHDGKSL